MRECQVLASLEVANVVRVFDTSGPDAAVPFIAMERLRGHDMASYLRERGRMTKRELLRMIREVGRGLDAAREAGIVHRDLKPRNVFLSNMPRGAASVWKILDFGIAKLAGEETMTAEHILGTPSYMAPEQASGGEVTHRTDLFALAVIVYRALTGRPAFTGDSVPAVLYQVVRRMPPAPSESGRSFPEEVDLVLGIALAKDPWDRFDSAAELADALDKAFRNKLPGALRERAERVLEKHPWDAEVKG
jgi:serine/threonine-protein kinase